NPVPAVAFEAARGVIGKPRINLAVDGDAAVIVEDNELGQRKRTRQRADLVRDAFHEAAIAYKYVGEVVDDVMTFAIDLLGHQRFGQGHAHRVGDTLPQRTGRGLDAGGDADFRVPGR